MSGHGEFESPVDLGGRYFGRNHPLRWTSVTIVTAALLLLATNATALRDWADEQTPGPLQAQVADLAHQWQEITDRAGLGAPRAVLADLWTQGEAARYQSGPAPKSDQR